MDRFEKRSALKVALCKFEKGDGLTDFELKMLLKFYDGLISSLEMLPDYALALREARRSYSELSSFKAFRRENRKV